MHIAVCMDVAADRKQIERLLNRSADRRIAEDESVPFYIQSFGNKSGILLRPLMYDMFFIDIQNDDSCDLIRELRNQGVTATIVYCPGKIDVSDRLNEADNVCILPQPVTVKQLEDIIDVAVSEYKSRVPMVEIRSTTETFKKLPSEILYAEKKKDKTLIYFTGEEEPVLSPVRIENFWECIRSHKVFFVMSDKLIVNRDYITSCGFSSIVLNNKIKLPVSRKNLKLYLDISRTTV